MVKMTKDFKSTKQEQITQYRVAESKYRKAGQLWLVPIVIGFIWIALGGVILFALAEYLSNGEIIVLILSLVAVGIVESTLLHRLRSNAVKSSILLQQLTKALEEALAANAKDETKMRRAIVEIETKFLANDDELFTKKYIWKHYLAHVDAKARDVEQGGDGKVLPHRMNLPAVWLKGETLRADNYTERNIVLPVSAIKRKIRGLRFVRTYRAKHDMLLELSKLASINDLVFERFLRNKKISKYLKEFKRAVRAFYLSPAAKMRLISFVNDVISERPYKTKTPDGAQLLAEKNEQIDQYTTDFWTVHRRSLKFYLFEAIWLIWIIPVLLLAVFLWSNVDVIAAGLVFFAGAALVVYGEMMLVTRQMIDLKGKKLMPPLIASLIAVRHNMCCSAGDADSAAKYRRYFKNAEKHFILTSNEIESVKYVQENLKEKKEQLAQGVTELCLKKKEQLGQYYEKFNFYRRRCMKFGCLEAFVALMVIPVYAFAFWVSYRFQIEDIDIVINAGYWAIGAITEFILIRRHIFSWRYKELYLLIYQELCVTLVDPQVMGDAGKLAMVFQKSEEEAIQAARLDNMGDAVQFIDALRLARR